MKKRARIKFGTGSLAIGSLALLGLGLLAFNFWTSENVPAPIARSQNSSTLNSVNERKADSPLRRALEKEDLEQIENILTTTKSPETNLIQVLHFSEKPDQNPAFAEKLLSLMLTKSFEFKELDPRFIVLFSRYLSAYSHSVEKIKLIEKFFIEKVPRRIQSANMEIAFSGTIPYPKNRAKSLEGKVLGPIPSDAIESIFIISGLKDQKSKASINKSLLNHFYSAHKEIKPQLAKYLFSNSNLDLRTSPSFTKLKEYVSSQKGELWREAANSQAQ